MRAGPLRNRCTVTRPHRQLNSSGGATQTWVEAGKVWAEITLPTGRVSPVAEQLEAIISAEIRIRPRMDIVAGWRLTHRGVTYQVQAPLIDNIRSMMRLLCSTVPNP
ncbi:phage head closure protein [Pseudomonas auratipiscis]|uniref:Phage head closure protein n=1 Tax=Pseudomonas auratipiscis TaxID=3115853 RepID=A0AB35WQS9_9PSED|nr:MULTISPECIES: phage head closure protein [unclassified Pseudomonas]MEE1866933.1 phage head closure protein [Pseudomonas sp. 120P]MEE1960631.1 phage head closure protein [Pseudomonas sp. 119P]